MGSKSKHAKEIITAIKKHWTDELNWIEPFVGGGNLIEKVTSFSRVGYDSNPYIIALLNSLTQGWVPPATVTETEYREAFDQIRGYTPKTLEDHVIGFIGFGCSYGGRFFEGYARGGTNKNGTPRNYASESKRNMLKMSSGLQGCAFYCEDYQNIIIPKNSIIYCDPPYEHTKQYRDKFEHKTFWKWATNKGETGYKIFVSEYTAPERWRCIWSKQTTSSLTANTGGKTATERLFMYDPN